MHSTRFNLPVILTEHARGRMAERNIHAALVLDIIDSGTLKEAGNSHYWLYKHLPDRSCGHASNSTRSQTRAS